MRGIDKLYTIAENQPRVFDAGKEKGYREGFEIGEANGYVRGHEDGYAKGKLEGYADGEAKGYVDGEQAEYDTFWDSFQVNGARTNYQAAFSQGGWNTTTFQPKYDIRPIMMNSIFYQSGLKGDFVEILGNVGVVFDTSRVTAFNYAFSQHQLSRFGTVDFRSAVEASYVFAYTPAIKTIDKIIVRDDGSNTFSGWFNGCGSLKNITFEGCIGKSINLSYCPLSVDSMRSVISCLKDFSGTDEENSYTVKFSDACWEALEADGPSPLGNTWAEYIANKCWLM